jgi:hypothetical protein
MKSTEFLTEYSRDITRSKLGDLFLMHVLKKDRVATNIEGSMPKYSGMINRFVSNSIRKGDEVLKKQLIDLFLTMVEDKDPTENKEYTPWLVRSLVKDQGKTHIEDINKADRLKAFHVGKLRRMIKPEHRDINQFAKYSDFDQMMKDNYDPQEILQSVTSKFKDPKYKVLYDDAEITMLTPLNQEAACNFGSKEWCTASPDPQHNLFNDYNQQGPLYTFIIKNPSRKDERYQLHFPSQQFKDENDRSYSFGNFVQDYPQLIPVIKNAEPEYTQDIIAFASEEELARLLDTIHKHIVMWLNEIVDDIADRNSSYQEWLYQTEAEYQTEDGDIDYERMAKDGIDTSPLGWDPDLKGIYDTIVNETDISVKWLQQYFESNNEEIGGQLPEVISVFKNTIWGLRSRIRGYNSIFTTLNSQFYSIYTYKQSSLAAAKALAGLAAAKALAGVNSSYSSAYNFGNFLMIIPNTIQDK